MRASPDLDGQAPDASQAQSRVTALVTGHFGFIWRFFRRRGLAPADADDAAQQVFIISMQKLASIVPGHERRFLYGTALRVASNRRRTITRRRETLEDDFGFLVLPGSPTEQRAELTRAWALLDELLGKLPDELARVLTLADIEELSVTEIAELEEIPVGTAASRLRRARERFREMLRKVEHRNPFGKVPP